MQQSPKAANGEEGQSDTDEPEATFKDVVCGDRFTAALDETGGLWACGTHILPMLQRSEADETHTCKCFSRAKLASATRMQRLPVDQLIQSCSNDDVACTSASAADAEMRVSHIAAAGSLLAITLVD